MKLYCTPEFLVEYNHLVKSNSYAFLESELIKLCNSTVQQVASLGTTVLAPLGNLLFIKKRLGGSGGFRCYLLTIVVNDEVFLGFVHPKTGSMGGENITDAKKEETLAELLAARNSLGLYLLKPDTVKPKKLTFIHYSQIAPAVAQPKNPVV